MSQMKSEQEAPQPPPTTTFSAAQWGTANPALQQAPQPTTTTPYAHYANYQHYPQASYSHYQYPPPQQPAATQPSQPPAPVTAAAAVAPKQPAQTAAMDTADIATLNDALGSAGVDLRAEEETLHRTYDPYQSYRPYEDRSRKQTATPNFDVRFLGSTIREVGTKHKVTKVPEDSVNYVALALRARLQDLLTAMIAASAHRTDTQYDRPSAMYDDDSPMWTLKVRNDVAKQLAAIEKVEREEEMKVRRERKERAEMAAAHQANIAAQASGAGASMAVDGPAGGEDGEGGAPKKKKKKEGPGVTARNMSEDVRKKMSNAVASQAAGLGTGKYAWMNAAVASTPTPKPKPVASTASSPAPGALTPATTTAPAASVAPANGGGWARPYVSSKTLKQATPPKEDDNRRVVTLKDAMFVIENERGHGGGKGAARGWS